MRCDLGDFVIDLTGLALGPASAVFADAPARLEAASSALKSRFRSGEVGFYDHVETAESGIGAIESAAAELRAGFQGALLFGIGGSHVGGATLQEALGDTARPFPVHWVSNADPAAIAGAAAFARGRKIAAVVISKSGNTTETMGAFFHFARSVAPKGVVAITDPDKGELRRIARALGWRAFDVPPNVGGRFSVLTAVGLFPAALSGHPAAEILAGAREMRRRLDGLAPGANPAYLLAHAKHHWDTQHGRRVHYLMPYRSNLRRLAEWDVQLWAESLGKIPRGGHGPGVGFTPIAALGTTDQHSQLQLMKEGPADKLVGFLDVAADDGPEIGRPPFDPGSLAYLCGHRFGEVSRLAGLATQKSLANAGVPTFRIELAGLTPRALGGFFFFMETACALAGELYGVNAFDQPGVEEAKRLLRESL